MGRGAVDQRGVDSCFADCSVLHVISHCSDDQKSVCSRVQMVISYKPWV